MTNDECPTNDEEMTTGYALGHWTLVGHASFPEPPPDELSELSLADLPRNRGRKKTGHVRAKLEVLFLLLEPYRRSGQGFG